MNRAQVRVLLASLGVLWAIPLLWLVGSGDSPILLAGYLGIPLVAAAVRWCWPRRPWRPESAVELLRPQIAALRDHYTRPSSPQERGDFPRYLALLDRLSDDLADLRDGVYTLETWRETHRSADDEEFASSSRHFQLRIERGCLRTSTWSNHASMYGAAQSMGTQTEQDLGATAPDGLRVFLAEMRAALAQPVSGGHVQGVDGHGQPLPQRVAEFGGARSGTQAFRAWA